MAGATAIARFIRRKPTTGAAITPDYGFEPVSVKTQPVSRLAVPEFRILKIHRAETRLRILGVSHEILARDRAPGRQLPEMSSVLRMPGGRGNRDVSNFEPASPRRRRR
jgi:hypothetical protein